MLSRRSTVASISPSLTGNYATRRASQSATFARSWSRHCGSAGTIVERLPKEDAQPTTKQQRPRASDVRGPHETRNMTNEEQLTIRAHRLIYGLTAQQ